MSISPPTVSITKTHSPCVTILGSRNSKLPKLKTNPKTIDDVIEQAEQRAAAKNPFLSNFLNQIITPNKVVSLSKLAVFLPKINSLRSESPILVKTEE